MSKFKLLLLFIVAHTLLIGADINKTIVSGDTKFYSQLEKNLDRTQPKDVLDLQKTLLNKLETLSLKRSRDKNLTLSPTPPLITNQSEYKKLFEKYLSKIVEEDNYNRELLKNQKNLASLKKQIKRDENVNLTKQLFYAYYSKQIDFLNSKIASIDNQFKLYQQGFTNSLQKIVFDNEKNIKISNSYENSLKKLKEKENAIKLKIEQSKLVDNNRSVEIFTKQLEEIKGQKQDLVHKKLVYDFLIFSKLLQDKEEKLFAHENSIYKFVENNYPKRYETLEDNLNQLFKNMKKEILGFIKTIEGESIEDVKELPKLARNKQCSSCNYN